MNQIMRRLGVNVSTRRVGGLRFLKIGRLTVSWSIAGCYRPMNEGAAS